MQPWRQPSPAVWRRFYADSPHILEKCWGTIGNTKLSVRMGDLTDEDAEAVVNAANGMLRHGGGVAAALVKKGGQQIQTESDDFVSRNGKIPDGSAAVTGAGNLPSRFIIHAVGPVWFGGTSNEKDTLRSAILSALNKAKELGVKSIAIPAVSSGIFGFPKDVSTDIIVSTAVEYARRPGLTLTDIRFTNNDVPTVMHVEKAFKRYIPHISHCDPKIAKN